jgi:hypothetical protein
MYESTLAEVLLARGRPHEAIEWLTRANEAAPLHAAYNEIRRDLAEALLCAHRQDQTRADAPCARAPAAADEVFSLVRKLELAREDRPFLSDYRQLDADWLRAHCVAPSPAFDSARAPAIVTRLEPPRKVHCGARTLHVGVPPIEGARVHVWGRDLDFLDHVYDERGKAIHLEARATHGQYFMQLLNEQGAPLGALVTFDSKLASRPADCREGDDEVRASFALAATDSDSTTARLSKPRSPRSHPKAPPASTRAFSSLTAAEQKGSGGSAEPESRL